MLREADKNNLVRQPGFPQDAATAPVFEFERTYAPVTRRTLFRFVTDQAWGEKQRCQPRTGLLCARLGHR